MSRDRAQSGQRVVRPSRFARFSEVVDCCQCSCHVEQDDVLDEQDDVLDVIARECGCSRAVNVLLPSGRRFDLLTGLPHECRYSRPGIAGVEVICLCSRPVLWLGEDRHLNLNDAKPHLCNEWRRARSR